jgi:hypothetical protein
VLLARRLPPARAAAGRHAHEARSGAGGFAFIEESDGGVDVPGVADAEATRLDPAREGDDRKR